MDKFTTHAGVGVPLKRSNVDTDQIIPAVYLKRVTRTGFEDGLFSGWRQDPDFVLHQDAFKNGSILVAGPDFFRGNSGKSGLLAALMEESDIELLWKLMEETPGLELTVDLEKRTVSAGEYILPFEVDDYTRWRLMEGLDDISLTLRNEDAIKEFEEKRPSFMPTTM